MAIRTGDWKLVKPSPGKGKAKAGEATAFRRDKATVDGAMLYDLAHDIGERSDVASANPERVKELAAAWQKWNAELMAPRWGPPSGKGK